MGTAALGGGAAKAASQAESMAHDLDSFDKDLSDFVDNAPTSKESASGDFGSNSASDDTDLDDILGDLI